MGITSNRSTRKESKKRTLEIAKIVKLDSFSRTRLRKSASKLTPCNVV